MLSTSAPAAVCRRCTSPPTPSVVVATDINASARVGGAVQRRPQRAGNIETRGGYYYAPVADESFDLITTNPPFVISPATTVPRLVYRDSGCRATTWSPTSSATGRHTSPTAAGSRCWPTGRSTATSRGTSALAGWVPDGCAALVVQREVLDPAAYVELWLKDEGLHGGPDYLDRYDAWLDLVRRAGRRGHRLRLGQRPQGSSTTAPTWTGRTPSSSRSRRPSATGRPPPHTRSASTTASRLRVDVVQETTGEPGAEDPETIVLRQQRGLRRARRSTRSRRGWPAPATAS